MPAIAVNIIIVHPWDVVFPQASPQGKQLPPRTNIIHMTTFVTKNNYNMYTRNLGFIS
jgi:hypothetical protein